MIVSERETRKDSSQTHGVALSAEDRVCVSPEGGAANGLVRSPQGEQFEVVESGGPVELQRAPPIPAEAREDLLVIEAVDFSARDGALAYLAQVGVTLQ